MSDASGVVRTAGSLRSPMRYSTVVNIAGLSPAASATTAANASSDFWKVSASRAEPCQAHHRAASVSASKNEGKTVATVFATWFGGFVTPPGLPVDARGAEALKNAGRTAWRDGEGVMFDETFIHRAENFSDRDRVILFCDVERPLRYRWAQAVNRFLGYTIVSAASSPNEAGDETGGINRVFRFFWHAGAYRRRLKKWSRPVYYLVKFSLIAAAIAFFLWV